MTAFAPMTYLPYLGSPGGTGSCWELLGVDTYNLTTLPFHGTTPGGRSTLPPHHSGGLFKDVWAFATNVRDVVFHNKRSAWATTPRVRLAG